MMPEQEDLRSHTAVMGRTKDGMSQAYAQIMRVSQKRNDGPEVAAGREPYYRRFEKRG